MKSKYFISNTHARVNACAQTALSILAHFSFEIANLSQYGGSRIVIFWIVVLILVVVYGFFARAVVIPNDRIGDFGDMLTIVRAEAKRILRTRENVNDKDILYSAKCGVHVIIFEVPESTMVEAKPLVVRGGSQRGG